MYMRVILLLMPNSISKFITLMLPKACRLFCQTSCFINTYFQMI